MRKLFVLLAVMAAPMLWAEGENVTINPPAEGSISPEQGLAAWHPSDPPSQDDPQSDEGESQ